MTDNFQSPIRILFDEENCQSCGLCSMVCPSGKIHTGDEKRPVIDNEAPCISCGQCIAVCPSEALSTDTSGFAAPKEAGAYRKGIDPVILASYLKSRRSVRIWKDNPVPRDILEKLIEIAAYAPSACNIHPVKWVVVENSTTIQEFVRASVAFLRTIPDNHPDKDVISSLVAQADLGFDPICRKAPALLIALTDYEWPFFKDDSVISLTYIDAYAPSIGIGTCWVGFVLLILALNPNLRKILGIPDGWIPQAAMIAGYPGVKYSQIPPRKTPEVIWR
jgi:nitroreductase/NAD-dependent dihydropyrimidine dehydrogenase PreA subunit